MIKKVVVLALTLFFLTNTADVLANHIGAGETCFPNDSTSHCIKGWDCQLEPPIPGSGPTYSCKRSPVSDIFGKIQPPDALKGLVSKDPTGAGGIGQFLSNLVALIYSIAAIVLIFMILWGAFDWMTSEGDKEKLSKAQQKIISALIGILLFAAAFAIIQVLGAFTGFEFFAGQKP